MSRQQEIRRALRFQYSQGAVAPGTVNTLKAEMHTLPHRHSFYSLPVFSEVECAWCLQVKVKTR